MSKQMYRPDVDGLRSLAILPVLLYHAGLPGFSGGFVGVDVFFVISGYLITSILIREFSNGTYSVSSFYERRVRRIFPALFVVLMFTLAISPFILLPSEFSSLGRDAASTAFFIANINFWRQSGYFAADAEAKPLLHMWSLGVEEQFYLVAPLALYLVFRYAPKYRLHLVGAAAALSLALCVYLTPIKPGAAFYLLPTRAWELLVGTWLALWVMAHPHKRNQASMLQSVLGLIGLCLILYSVFAFSKATEFPGYAALAPTLGAALLIHSGQFSLTGRLLSWRPLVGIGLISYSLYLWHWPLIVAFRNLGWLTSAWGMLAVVATSFMGAWATWRWVETPTRNRVVLPPRRMALAAVVFSLLLLVISGIYSKLEGWPSRVSAQVLAFDQAREDRSPERERCHIDAGAPDPRKTCVLGGDSPRIVVWGDSHGVELAQAISERGLPVREITYSSCPPALSFAARSDRPLCGTHNERVFDYLVTERSIETVVMASYYGVPFDASSDLQVHLAQTAARLAEAGKHVVVVGAYPSIDGHTDIPSYLARGGAQVIPFKVDGTALFRERLGSAATLFAPTDIFCEQDRCELARDGAALFFDAHHPSMHAAREVASRLQPIIESASTR